MARTRLRSLRSLAAICCTIISAIRATTLPAQTLEPVIAAAPTSFVVDDPLASPIDLPQAPPVALEREEVQRIVRAELQARQISAADKPAPKSDIETVEVGN